MFKKNKKLYFPVALIAALPHILAEYRRIVLGIYDVTYWILSGLLILSGYCLYQTVGKTYMRYADPTKDSFTIKCNAFCICVVIIAVYALIVSTVIRAVVPGAV
jgi:hypothetical protein